MAGGAAAAIALAADDGAQDGVADLPALGFIGRVDQVGRSVTAMAYVTRVHGFSTRSLYTAPPGQSSDDPRSKDPSTARLTLFCEAEVEALSTVPPVISSVLRGDVAIYLQPAGGARFSDPRSFARGRRVASFKGSFQNDLGVDAPDRAAVALSADLTQERSGRLELDGTARRFGREGEAWTLRATGRGERLERTGPRVRLLLSGDMEVVDAGRPRPS